MEKKKIDKIIDIVRSLKEDVPANNASSGAIAGLPPDQPPVRKKKKYIYQKGLRKMWSPTDGRSN
jgi:hypothetical protein